MNSMCAIWLLALELSIASPSCALFYLPHLISNFQCLQSSFVPPLPSLSARYNCYIWNQHKTVVERSREHSWYGIKLRHCRECERRSVRRRKRERRSCLITTKNHLIVSSKRVRAQELEFHSSNPRVESSGANREKKVLEKCLHDALYLNIEIIQIRGMEWTEKINASWVEKLERRPQCSRGKILNVHAKEEKILLDFQRWHTRTPSRE